MYVIIDTGACCHYVLLGGLFSSRQQAETYCEEFARAQYAWGAAKADQSVNDFVDKYRQRLVIQDLALDPAIVMTVTTDGTTMPDCEIWP